MSGTIYAVAASEVLAAYERQAAHPELDGEGIELWVEYAGLAASVPGLCDVHDGGAPESREELRARLEALPAEALPEAFSEVAGRSLEEVRGIRDAGEAA